MRFARTGTRAKRGRTAIWGMAALAVALFAASAAQAVVLFGRGELHARGSGAAFLELRGAVTASGVGLAIVEEDTIVETRGEGRVTPLGDGRVLLEGFGWLSLRSLDERMRVELAGAKLRLRARGVGFARLRGVGSFWTEDVAGFWGADLRLELAE